MISQSLEFGTNHFGEIENLARIAHPTISVLTNIGESHLAFLKTPAGVFREKKAIYKNLNKNGIVVFNNDDFFLKKISLERSKARKVSFSIQRRSSCQAKSVKRTEKGIEFSIGSKKIFIKAFSSSYVYNALCAIVVGRLFKIPYKRNKRMYCA